MFWIRPSGIKYYNTERHASFTAHLLTADGDVHVGVVRNLGNGSGTFIDCMEHHREQLKAIQCEFGIRHFETLLDYYMDIAEGAEGVNKELCDAIANYKPE